MTQTLLKRIKINRFRALKDVEIEFGKTITVICGKNGTAKSSILGIAAQVFSFEKDYNSNENLHYRQITGTTYKSLYREHFRISDKYDVPGSMDVTVELHDGYSGKDATGNLELMSRRNASRPVVRNNSIAATQSGNTSRNFTHPVIFLSLKRLYPIASREYTIKDFDYLKANRETFIGLTNELLNRSSSFATGTTGTISSAVSYGDNYDHESVSAGEDNAGQIALAIMSFKKLKREYSDYKGGMLLIDEADAGLFPEAQLNLLKILNRECRELDLQAIMTSHSPALIEQAFQMSKTYQRNYKTVYLSNTFGDLKVYHDWSWERIYADIHTKPMNISKDRLHPKINIYFEDREAADFFGIMLNRQPIKTYINPLKAISIGCSNYLQLLKKGVIEFSEKSIICLDGDQFDDEDAKSFKSVVVLPGELPPDQLIFECLYNLPADDEFWSNDRHFTRNYFTNTASELIKEFGITGNNISVKKILEKYKGPKKPRELFKKFYKSQEFQKLICGGSAGCNAWAVWVKHNPEKVNEFLEVFKDALSCIMKKGFCFGVAALPLLELRLKKV